MPAKILGKLALLCSAIWLFLPTLTMADAVHYTVTELRFPDSPLQGAILPPPISWEPQDTNPHICKVLGLSRNNQVTGLIVAASGVDHWFVYDSGKISDLTKNPRDRCLSSTISPDGTVVALTSPAQPANGQARNLLQVYDRGRLRQIGFADNELVDVEQLNTRGDYLLKGAPGSTIAFLCSIRTSARIKAPDLGATLNEAGTEAGIEWFGDNPPFRPAMISHGTPYLFTNCGGAGAVCTQGCLNETGQFISTTAPGLSRQQQVAGVQVHYHAWLIDEKTHSVKEVPVPAGADPQQLVFVNMCIDDAGDVTGALGPPGEHSIADYWPFYYHNGQTVRFSSLVPNCASIQLLTPDGKIIGGTTDHHLFLYDHGTSTDLGSLGGDDATAFAINKEGQIVGVATTPDDQWHAFIWANGHMTDLNTYLPPDVDYVLGRGLFINDNGVIAARGHAKPGATIGPNVSRWWVLTPDTPPNGTANIPSSP